MKLLAVAPGHRLHREQIQEMCWPDAAAGAATNNLRVALHAARRALEPELAPRAASSYLLSEGALLSLHPERVVVDADEAEARSLAALAEGAEGALESALAAHAGEFLPEDRYTEWAAPRRDLLAGLRLRLLVDLAGLRLGRDEFDAAADTARLALAVSPAEERVHQLLMSAHLGRGLRAQAVRQYELCRDALAKELSVAPSAETERLRGLAVGPPAPVAPVAAGGPPRAPHLPAAALAAAREPLYGRDALLAELVGEGGHPVVLVGGEAGLGKTRLVGHAARRLAERGAVVLWGATHDAEGPTPYGPFVEALDDWLAGRPAAERAHWAATCPELAPLLSALRTSAPALVPAPRPAGPLGAGGAEGAYAERLRLFQGVERLLGALGRGDGEGGDGGGAGALGEDGGGVVVVLDDLHAADPGTFHLLARLARRAAGSDRLRCRFLVTWRDDEPFPEDHAARLDDLVGAGLARRVPVPRLSREDSDALVLATLAALGRAPAGTARLDAVWRLSLGNPLFAVELASAPERAADSEAYREGDTYAEGDTYGEGGPDPDGGTYPGGEPYADGEAYPDGEGPVVPPAGVRHLVARRLGRIGADARRMAEVVSAAAGTAPLTEVLAVAREGLHPPLSDAAASAALEEAVAAALLAEQRIVVGGRATTGLAFRHPLIRRTCYGLLGGLRARRLHAAWSEALLRHRPDDVDALAGHLWRAEDPRAAGQLRRAAERAAELYANEAADAYYRRLLPLLAGSPAEAAEAGLDHGTVLHRMSRYPEAAVVLRAALAAARAADAPDTVVSTAARLAEALIRAGGAAEAGRVLDACSPGAGTAPAAEAAHWLARSVLLFVEGRPADAVAPAAASARAAAGLPGRTGVRALARALVQQAASLGLADRLAESDAIARKALAYASEGDAPGVEAVVLSVLRENARRSGRLAEALGFGEAAARLADRTGSPEAQAFERTNLAELHLLLGRPAEAEELARAAERLAREQAERTQPYACAVLARLRADDDPGEARELLARGEAVALRTGDRQALDEVLLARAELTARSGAPHAALADVDRTAPSSRAACLRAWVLVLAGRAPEAVPLMEREAARAEEAGRRLVAVEATTVLALALGATGATPRSEAAFASAHRAAKALPYPLGLHRIAAARADLTAAAAAARPGPGGVR
ncbi:AAA family ATPase [Streptomyces sp. NPDC058486]|uniref:AAA family ATPase n=1 Tax=unclassified Streptomyces TaxID=2593676 RepID=UPI00364B95B9